MDAKGLRALLGVLVVVGCVLALLSVAPVGAVAGAGATETPLQEAGGTAAAPVDDDTGAVAAMLQDDDAPTEDYRLDHADEIHIDVHVHENGTATFSAVYQFENNATEEWEELEADIEENPEAYAAVQQDNWNEILLEGENATEREMELSNVSIGTDTSSAPRDLGLVEVTFRWSSFAYVEWNRIEVGDALSDFTLPSDTSIRFHAPDGYAIEDVEPSPEDRDEGTVFWDSDGAPFSSDPPLVVMIEESNDDGEAGEPDDGPAMPWLIVLTALALLVGVGTAGWWFTRADGSRTPAPGETGHPVAGDSTDAAGDAESNGPPPELLSNEERVLRLLESRGGRIKQQEVVSELDWTEAKTSQVVGGLREDGEVEVFRIGRENVLALPEEDDEE